MRWLTRLWRRPANGHEVADLRRRARLELIRVRRQTANYERVASSLSYLSDDEWARRVAEAFRAR